MNINTQTTKKYLPIGIICIAFLIAAVLVGFKKDEKKKNISKYVPLIETFNLKKQDFQVYLDKEGYIVSKYEYPLISEVYGEILFLSEFFNNNQIFEKGELLMQIDSSYYSIDRRNAKALLDAAILDNEMQQAIYERSQIELNQYDKKDISDLAKKIPQLNSSQSSLDAAMANYERALLNLGKTSFKAPFRGRVKNNYSSKGMVVSQGSQLATIYSIEDLIVRLPLQLGEVGFLDDFNKNFKIDLLLSIGQESYPLKGKYEGISGAVDRMSQSVFLNISLNDFHDLELIVDNNLFIEAKIYGKKFSNVYVLPNSAIREDSVIHIVEQNKLRALKVEILKTYRDSSVIKSEIIEDKNINLTPLEYYVDKMEVKVINK